MAAAYAALMSLTHTLEVILHPSQQRRLCVNRTQLQSLLQKVRSLDEFLQRYSHIDHQEMAALECRIADTARAADSVIDYHVLDQIVSRSTGSEAESSTCFSDYVQNLTKEMDDLIETRVMRIKETIEALEDSRPLADFSPAVSSSLVPEDRNSMVGSDEKLIEIMDTLTGQQSNRQIIAIVGMGGIGKTTLAKNVYKHPHTVSYFHICAWVTISQNYSAREVVLEMLSEIDQSKHENVPSGHQLDGQLYRSKQESVLTDDQLGEQLYKILSGKRYLIVVDDIWSVEAWNDIRAFFPDNCNGSRIMITTRLLNVARLLSSARSFEMEFLDDNRSWELLCDTVFGKESCPSELEELGKDIAKKCGGLPLAIVVIGGLLAKSNKVREVWEDASGNLNSIINSGDDENCLKILNLSYKNLPIHLKPCFLCIAAISRGADYPKYDDLPGLLVAEGILKPMRDKSLEEVANEYLTDLIDRNLVMVRRRGILGHIKDWGVHDLLRNLCLRQAQKENLLSATDELNRDIPLKLDLKRCLSFPVATKKFTPSDTQVLDLLRQASLLRSTTRVFASRLVVWNVSEEAKEFHPVEEEVTQLPYFLRLCSVRSPSSNSLGSFIPCIHRFWCLQSLIVRSSSKKLIILPTEIWDLPQLRHLVSNEVGLRGPRPSHNDEHVLENLQTLFGVVGFRCLNEVLKRAPNLKTLGVAYGRLPPSMQWRFFLLYNLVHLHKLESLRFRSVGPISSDHLSFPLSLKLLVLSGCNLPWDDMTIVGSLPNLESLWLQNYAFKGHEWCPNEGEFLRLKVLAIVKTDLSHWRADKTHFPILNQLVLRKLRLKEFPQDFGELLTLRMIEVFSCSKSTNTWAEQVREEQESFGNEGLQVVVRDDD